MKIREQIEDFKGLTKGIFPRHFPGRLAEMGYFTLPAALHHHGKQEGDLYLHSKLAAMALMDLTDRAYLEWGRPESPMIVGLFHDLCKLDDYRWEDGEAILNPHRKEGHGAKSAEMVKELIKDVTEEELCCIRYHMGAYEGQQVWKELGEAIRKYPNILWTHHVDMLASQIWRV